MLEERKRMLKCFAFIMYPIFLIAVIRFSSIKADNLIKFIDYMEQEMKERPLHFEFTMRTIKAILIFSIIYLVVFYMIITSLKDTMPGKEHDSAHWVDGKKVSKKMCAKKGDGELPKEDRNMVFSKNVRVSIDSPGANINTLVIGEPGSKKTRSFIIPNMLQLNCNMVVTDPKGGATRSIVKSYGTARLI